MQLRVYLTIITIFCLGFSVSHAYWRESRKKMVSKNFANWLNGSNTNVKKELINWHWLKQSLAPSSLSSKPTYDFIKKLTKSSKLLNLPLIKSSKYSMFSKPSSVNRNAFQTVRLKLPFLNSYFLPSQNFSLEQLHPYSLASPSSALYYLVSPDYLIFSKFKPKYTHLPSSSLTSDEYLKFVWNTPTSHDTYTTWPKTTYKFDKLKVKSRQVNSNLKRKASKKLRYYESSKSSRKLTNEWNDNIFSSGSSLAKGMTKIDPKYRKYQPKPIKSSNELENTHYNNQYKDTSLPNSYGWRPKGKASWFPGTHKSAFYSPDTRLIKFTFNDIVKKPNDTLVASSTSISSSNTFSTPSSTPSSTPFSTPSSTSFFKVTDNKENSNDQLSESNKQEKVKLKVDKSLIMLNMRV